MLVDMSMFPLRLTRSPSTLSILRSLETLSPPASWSNLDNLAASSCQIGSIPVILHAGVGDLPDLNAAFSDTEQDDPCTIDSSELASKEKSILNDNRRAVSLTGNSKPLEGWDVQMTKSPSQETRPMERLSQAILVLPLQSSAIRPVFEFVPQSPWIRPTLELSRDHYSSGRRDSVTHKGSVPLPSKQSPTSCSTPPHTQRPSSPSSSDTGNLSGSEKLPRRSRNGSTSPTYSGSSPRSNRPLDTCDANRGGSEIPDVDFARFPLLPASLSWVQSTALEVMIDQEGFRVIRPIFRLAGYSRPITTESEAMPLDTHLILATADFMPARRKSFVFHYSALDTPPVLRRLMVNGDESRDYLSRQAYLVLKSNGPYTVQGSEPVHSSRAFSAAEPLVLSWRFDYVVGDRRTKTGRIIPGEKTFTPLNFSCSPALLQPTQARKIRVVHVVRKSVVTKLTATKMEAPTPPYSHPALGSAPLCNFDSEPRETASTTHRLVRSHVPQNAVTLGIPTHDSALTSASPRGASGSSPLIDPPLGTRTGASGPIVIPETIDTLFPVDASHVVHE